MIFPITSEAEVLMMMDENDYQEHLLLTSLDEKEQQENYFSKTVSEATSSLMDEDEEANDSEFLNTDKVGEITPTKSSEESTSSPNTEEKKPTSDDPAEVGIPGKFDVLCGQSRICANHTGNRRFQVVLDIYAPKYDGSSTSKQEKMALTKEIVSCIEAAGGRFLKYKEGLWQEISTVTARDKVSHALRTKVASWKRQQQQQGKSDLSPSSRPTHRRRRSSTKRRCSSSSIATSASDILTTSFDGSSDSANSIMDGLLKTQREIFANLTQGNSSGKHPLKKD